MAHRIDRPYRSRRAMRLRVLSWNIHKCTGGLDRRYAPERTARLIEVCDPDIAMLQEVAEGGSWYRGDRQIDILAELVGLPHYSYFVNVRFGRRRGAYGNAILSRWPITTAENLDISQPQRKRRSVLHAQLRVPLGHGRTRTLHLFNMHLGLSERERRQQLCQFMAGRPFSGLRRRTPIVLAGDLNDVWGTLGSKLLEPRGFVSAARPQRTFPAYAPLRALDNVYVRGSLVLERLRAVRRQPARLASDHLPLLAELLLLT